MKLRQSSPPAKIVLTVGGVNLTHEVKDEIELG